MAATWLHEIGAGRPDAGRKAAARELVSLQSAGTMTDVDILAKLTAIFRQVLYNDSLLLTSETTAADVPDWDSMTNITLVVEVEHEFGLKFKTAEIEGLSDVGALVALIRSRLAAVAA